MRFLERGREHALRKASKPTRTINLDMRFLKRGRKLVSRQVGKHDRNIWKCDSPKGDEGRL